MNKLSIKIFILLIFTVWQLKSETLELTNDDKKILNSFFENENEYFTIIGQLSNFLNCQTNYLDKITTEFKSKTNIKFAYTLVVDAKNDSYLLKNFSKTSKYNEVLNKKIKIIDTYKADFLLVYYRNGNYTIYEIDFLKEFYDKELDLFTKDFKELKYIKTIENYDNDKPIISLLKINDSLLTEFYNYDILKLDSNFNLNLECNYTNQIYTEDSDDDGINDVKMLPLLNNISNIDNKFILDFSLFVASENKKSYGFHSVFLYDYKILNGTLFKFKNTNAILNTLYHKNELFLLNEFNNSGNIDKKTLIFKFNQKTLFEESYFSVSDLKINENSKNKLNINEFGINKEYMFLIDYLNQEYYKINMNNLKNSQKNISYSNFVKKFKSDLIFGFSPENDTYNIYHINHSLIIKEQYLSDTDKLIDQNVYKLPSNLSSSDIIYFYEFIRNDRTYYMLKTNDIGFVLLEQP